LDFYQGITPDFIDATFSSNHDQPRLLNDLKKDPAKYKQALAILMTLPGAPYLYYGEEIGMLGLKPDEQIREPFLWDKKELDRGRTTWIVPQYSTEGTVTPLAQQRLDKDSYFNHYKNIIALRHANPALAIGNLVPSSATYPSSLMVYLRQAEGQELLVMHHLGTESIEVVLPEGFTIPRFATAGVSLQSGKVLLPPYSSLVLERNP
jgi:glycosidase